MSLKFTFGGVKRELRIELALAPKFEEVTGRGYLELTQALVERKAKIIEVAEVLRVAFEANGSRYTSEEILELMRHDDNGIVNAYVFAALIVMELCKRPDTSTKGKAPKAKPNGAIAGSH